MLAFHTKQTHCTSVASCITLIKSRTKSRTNSRTYDSNRLSSLWIYCTCKCSFLLSFCHVTPRKSCSWCQPACWLRINRCCVNLALRSTKPHHWRLQTSLTACVSLGSWQYGRRSWSIALSSRACFLMSRMVPFDQPASCSSRVSNVPKSMGSNGSTALEPSGSPLVVTDTLRFARKSQ